MDEKKLTLARRVIAALRGDTDSYKVLFEEAAPDVWDIVKKYFLNDDDANTALETTFATVAETFADQKDPTDYLGWVKRIAHLTAAAQAAKVGGLADAEVKDLNLLTLSDYKKEKKDGVLTFATVKDLTEKVLAALPLRQRTELLLWNEGYSVAEIAKKLGISPGSVVGGLNIAKTKVEDETKAWEADGFDYTKYAASPMSFFTRLMREKFDGSYVYTLPEDKGWSWTSLWDGFSSKLKWPAIGVGAAAATGLIGKYKDVDLDLPGFDWKAKLADAKVDLPDVDLKAKLPEVDVKKAEVELPKVEVKEELPYINVKKKDVDVKKVGAAAAAGAAAVGAAAAAKAKDVDVKLPKVDVDVKKPDVDVKLPKVDVKKPDVDVGKVGAAAAAGAATVGAAAAAKAAGAKADVKAGAADVKAGVAAAKKEADEKAAAAAAAVGKKKGLGGIWKWLLPLLALLLLLCLLIGGLRGCNKGKVDGNLDVKVPEVTVKAPEAEVVEGGSLGEYVYDVDVKTKTVPVTVNGSVLNIGTNDIARFVTGLNIANTNPLAYVVAHTSTADSILEKLAYSFPNIPEVLDGTLTELKFTDSLGAEKSFQFATTDGILNSVTLADPNGDAIETATYNYDKKGTLSTVTLGDKTLNYAEDLTPTATATDEDANVTRAEVGDNWAACQYDENGNVSIITYDWNGKTGARAFAYNDDGALKTYQSFQKLMK